MDNYFNRYIKSRSNCSENVVTIEGGLRTLLNENYSKNLTPTLQGWEYNLEWLLKVQKEFWVNVDY